MAKKIKRAKRKVKRDRFQLIAADELVKDIVGLPRFETEPEKDCSKIAAQIFQLVDMLHFRSEDVKENLNTACRYGCFWGDKSEVFIQIMNLIEKNVAACIEPLDFLAGELRVYMFDKRLNRRGE